MDYQQQKIIVVPAQPDWWLLDPVTDGAKKTVDIAATQIIAWGITVYERGSHGEILCDPLFTAYPITVEGLPSKWAIQDNTGRVYLPDDRQFQEPGREELLYLPDDRQFQEPGREELLKYWQRED